MPQQGSAATGVIGKVKFFNDTKGFGFLIREDTGEELFVHYTGIDAKVRRRTLLDGQIVEFDVVFDTVKKKFMATNVRVVSKP